jgi:hypothetical protein
LNISAQFYRDFFKRMTSVGREELLSICSDVGVHATKHTICEELIMDLLVAYCAMKDADTGDLHNFGPIHYSFVGFQFTKKERVAGQ